MPAPLIDRLHHEAARAASPRVAALLREAAIELVKKQVLIDSIADSVLTPDATQDERFQRIVADLCDSRAG